MKFNYEFKIMNDEFKSCYSTKSEVGFPTACHAEALRRRKLRPHIEFQIGNYELGIPQNAFPQEFHMNLKAVKAFIHPEIQLFKTISTS